jgi:hypothetical protein
MLEAVMGEEHSAAAQTEFVDTELLIFDAARAFHAARTPDELDAEWKARICPAYDQLSERSLSILSSLYGLNSTLIERGLR